MSTRRVAHLVGRSSSHVSRWETGNLTPSEADTATVLAVLGVTGDERERLLELARDALDPNWIAPGVDKQLAALADYERTARRIVDVEPLVIPGLLQTIHYARAVMMQFGATRAEADHRATLRMGRQHVLTDRRPVELVAMVGEYALRHPPCSDEIMAGQLAHLLDITDKPHVTVQVLPMHTPTAPALTGPWAVIEDVRAKPVVHLEHYCSSATITDDKTVSRYREAADTMRTDAAMSPEESVELIATIAKGMETP